MSAVDDVPSAWEHFGDVDRSDRFASDREGELLDFSEGTSTVGSGFEELTADVERISWRLRFARLQSSFTFWSLPC